MMAKRSNSIEAYVNTRLADGVAPMTIQREAEERFGHCGWLYVLKIKRKYEASKRSNETQMR